MADLYPSTTSSPYPSLDTVQNHPKAESKPQATFLTKLYALLERPENHHMIRWDPQGEHIIVERPEQLALHVLPSIYRQSRFASFSRQLNIYGFMRKVNLRNVDPAIDDPDASTWSHPTLNRHSPPEVVANFKRRVPPRLPKPRKRDLHESQLIPPPRSAIPSGGPPSPTKLNGIPPPPLVGRARGFSAPGSFTPAWASAAGAQSNGFPRSSIPPLTVPGASDPPSHSYADDPASPTSSSYSSHYSHQNHYPSNPYPDVSSHQWFGSPTGSSSSNSLSSLLNPSTRPTPTINTSVNGSGSSGGYVSPYSSIPLHGHGHHHHGGSDHSSSAASPLSPDAHSRPHTSYSMSQMGYGSEDSGYAPGPPTSAGGSSRPNSSHRQLSPSPRPPSSNRGSPYHTSSSMTHSHSASSSFRNGHGRVRRHSQAISPYPLPYDHSHSGGLGHHTRPSTSPQPHHQTHHSHHHGHPTHGTSMANGGTLPRVRSMIQLPSVEPTGSAHAHYGSYASAHSHPSNGSDFAYSPVSGGGSAIPSIPSSSSISSLASVSSSAYSPLDYRHSGRPGTSTSSISQNSSSQANTPPLDPFPTSGTGEGKFSVSGENGHGTGYPEEGGMGVAVVNVRGYVATDDTFGFTVPSEYGGA